MLLVFLAHTYKRAYARIDVTLKLHGGKNGEILGVENDAVTGRILSWKFVRT